MKLIHIFLESINCIINLKITNFIFVGNIQSFRKNFLLLFENIEKLIKYNILNFNVTIIGYSMQKKFIKFFNKNLFYHFCFLFTPLLFLELNKCSLILFSIILIYQNFLTSSTILSSHISFYF